MTKVMKNDYQVLHFLGFRGELLGIVRLPVVVAVAGGVGVGGGGGAPPTSPDTFNSLGGRGGGRLQVRGVNYRVLVRDSSLRGHVFV